MPTGDHPLDHLVYAVPELQQGIEVFRRQLGVAPALGGRHQGMGTHNAILPLRLPLRNRCYVELIARDPGAPEPQQPRPFGLDSLKEPRLVTWAVRSESIETTVARSKQCGYDPGIVFAMSRAQPDGEALQWKLSLRAEPFGGGLVPFVIDWGNTPHPTAVEPDPPCTLESFHGFHPEPAPVERALDALAVELAVRRGTAARLEAVLSGPSGKLQLN